MVSYDKVCIRFGADLCVKYIQLISELSCIKFNTEVHDCIHVCLLTLNIIEANNLLLLY